MRNFVLVTPLEKTVSLAATFGLFALASLSATQAEARLTDAVLPILTETHHDAIHLPTGCIARVIIDHSDFVSAAITDPECLPKGVASRTVPGSLFDFEIVRLP